MSIKLQYKTKHLFYRKENQWRRIPTQSSAAAVERQISVQPSLDLMEMMNFLFQRNGTDVASHMSTVSYTGGLAGTGQPSVSYPLLDFQPAAFYALGSPVGEASISLLFPFNWRNVEEGLWMRFYNPSFHLPWGGWSCFQKKYSVNHYFYSAVSCYSTFLVSFLVRKALRNLYLVPRFFINGKTRTIFP